jgi:hypothetical protein
MNFLAIYFALVGLNIFALLYWWNFDIDPEEMYLWIVLSFFPPFWFIGFSAIIAKTINLILRRDIP